MNDRREECPRRCNTPAGLSHSNLFVIAFQFELLPAVAGVGILINVGIVPQAAPADIPAHPIVLEVELAGAIQLGRDSNVLVSNVSGIVLPQLKMFSGGR